MESIECPCLASPSSASTKLQIPNSKIPNTTQATNPKDTLFGGLGFGILPARDLSELGFGVWDLGFLDRFRLPWHCHRIPPFGVRQHRRFAVPGAGVRHQFNV